MNNKDYMNKEKFPETTIDEYRGDFDTQELNDIFLWGKLREMAQLKYPFDEEQKRIVKELEEKFDLNFEETVKDFH